MGKTTATPNSKPSNYEKIYAVVRRVPRACVATYGQVAAMAGVPRGARQVGYALHRCPVGARVPWQRIVNSRGEISTRSETRGAESLQMELLRAEGVEFDAKGRVDLARYQWRPKGGRGRAVSGIEDDLPVDLETLT